MSDLRTEAAPAVAFSPGEPGFRAIADALPAMAWATDLAGTLCWASPSWRSRFGEAPSWLEGIHPEDLPAARSFIRTADRPGAQRSLEYRRLADGKYAWVRDEINLYSDARDAVYLLGVSVDVSVRHLIEDSARENVERFRRLVGANIMIIMAGEGDRVTEANQRFHDLFGYTPADLASGTVTLSRMTPPGFEAVDARVREELARHGRCESYEKAFYRRDGSIVPVLVATAVVAGDPLRWVSALTDVSGQKLAEERIFALNRELRRRISDLETLLEVIPIGIGIANDPECEDIRVNPAFAAMLGIAPTTNASKHGQAGARLPFRITRAGSEVPSPELPMQRAARTGETLVNEEFTVEFPAGRPPLRLLEFAAPLLDEDGQPRGAVGAFVDITERRRTEEAERFLADVGRALSESLDYDATIQRLARVSCEALADYCLVDVLASDGAIQRKAAAGATRELDELAQGLLPYPPDTSGRNPIVSVMVTGVPRVGPAPPQQVEDRVAQDETHRRIIRAIGARTWLCVPLIAHGTTIGALTFGSRSENRYGDFELAVAQQVADRAAIAISNATLYQESKRAADDLRRASAVKDEFLGMMSHELRTPLTGILGNAQILRRHGDRIPASFRDSAIADIEHEADRLKRLVENMLVLAQVEAEHDIIPEPVLLQRLALDVVEEHRRRHPWRHVNCVVDSGLLPVRAAPVYVEQVLRNLISNAEKYSENDEKIEVQVLSMGDSVGAIVLDRGVGVPGEELEMLFRPFFRSDSTAHTASGAGLGLAVCKRLIEVQSGRIWAAPRQDGGMEFGFSLPVQKE